MNKASFSLNVNRFVKLGCYFNQESTIFTIPQRSWGKVIFLHVSVILFTGVGGLPQCILGYHPLEQTPPSPRADTSPEQTPAGRRHPPRTDPPQEQKPPSPLSRLHPREQCMLGDTGNKRAASILLECVLVHLCFRGVKNKK